MRRMEPHRRLRWRHERAFTPSPPRIQPGPLNYPTDSRSHLAPSLHVPSRPFTSLHVHARIPTTRAERARQTSAAAHRQHDATYPVPQLLHFLPRASPRSLHLPATLCQVPIPGSALTTAMSSAEARRRALQGRMVATGGWGAWHPHNYLELISLPDSARVRILLCSLSTKVCLTSSVGPDDGASTLRPGLHSSDRSYAEMYS